MKADPREVYPLLEDLIRENRVNSSKNPICSGQTVFDSGYLHYLEVKKFMNKVERTA